MSPELNGMSASNYAKMMEDFKFADSVGVTPINGEQYLTTEGVPLNAYTEMTESEFVEKWLLPFAVNDTTGVNYFNFIEWGKISNQHTMSVLVIDDNDPKKILLVIKPISGYQMTPIERDIMRQTSAAMANSAREIMEGQTPQLDGKDIVDKASTFLDPEKARIPMHDLIPIDFYHKHNVYPEALRKAFYVRDVVFEGKADMETLDFVKKVFETEERDGVASLEDYKLVKLICGAWYTIPEHLLNDKTLTASAKETVNINDNDNNRETDEDQPTC